MPATRCTCPSCGAALKFPDPLPAGEEVRCPRCSTVFPVPRAEERVQRVRPVNRRRGRDPDDDFPDDDEPDLDEEEEDRPRRRRRKGAALPWWLKAILLTGGWSALLVAVPATIGAFLTETDEQAERLGRVVGQLICLPWLAGSVLIWVLCYVRDTRQGARRRRP
jgi:hypothetical protein